MAKPEEIKSFDNPELDTLKSQLPGGKEVESPSSREEKNGTESGGMAPEEEKNVKSPSKAEESVEITRAQREQVVKADGKLIASMGNIAETPDLDKTLKNIEKHFENRGKVADKSGDGSLADETNSLYFEFKKSQTEYLKNKGADEKKAREDLNGSAESLIERIRKIKKTNEANIKREEAEEIEEKLERKGGKAKGKNGSKIRETEEREGGDKPKRSKVRIEHPQVDRPDNLSGGDKSKNDQIDEKLVGEFIKAVGEGKPEIKIEDPFKDVNSLDELCSILEKQENIRYQNELVHGKWLVGEIKRTVGKISRFDPEKKFKRCMILMSRFEDRNIRRAIDRLLVKSDPVLRDLSVQHTKDKKEQKFVDEVVGNHLRNIGAKIKINNTKEQINRYIEDTLKTALDMADDHPDLIGKLEKAYIDAGYLKPQQTGSSNVPPALRPIVEAEQPVQTGGEAVKSDNDQSKGNSMNVESPGFGINQQPKSERRKSAPAPLRPEGSSRMKMAEEDKAQPSATGGEKREVPASTTEADSGRLPGTGWDEEKPPAGTDKEDKDEEIVPEKIKGAPFNGEIDDLSIKDMQNHADFARYLALYPESEGLLMSEDEEGVRKIFEVYVKKEKVSEGLRGEIQKYFEQAVGVNFTPEELEGIEGYIEKQAFEDPDRIKGLADEFQALTELKKSNSKLENDIIKLAKAGGEEGLAHEIESLSKTKKELEKLKSGFSFNRFKRFMRVIFRDAFDDQFNLREEKGIRSEEDAKAKIKAIDEKLKKAEANLNNLRNFKTNKEEIEEDIKNIRKGLFEGVPALAEITELAEQKAQNQLKEMMNPTKDPEEAYKYFERMMSMEDQDGIEIFGGVIREEIQEKIDEAIDSKVTEDIANILKDFSLGSKGVDRLAGSLKKHIERKKIGSRKGDEAKDSVRKLMGDVYKGLGDDRDSKAKKGILMTILREIQQS